MIKNYLLTKEHQSQIEKDFFYVVSPATKAKATFIYNDDHISNQYNENIFDFDYISIVTQKKYSCGVKIKTICSFDSFGAPLIVISDDITNGKYGLHFEIVAYEDGCNVWHILPSNGKAETPIIPSLIASAVFKISEKSVIELQVTVKNKMFEISINGNKLTVSNSDIPEQFHVGITACEGVNRFYSLSIENN